MTSAEFLVGRFNSLFEIHECCVPRGLAPAVASFNSLFEMPVSVDDIPQKEEAVSILYLRCLPYRGCCEEWEVEECFNSLFEMQRDGKKTLRLEPHPEDAKFQFSI